jgi:hypothetical protein
MSMFVIKYTTFRRLGRIIKWQDCESKTETTLNSISTMQFGKKIIKKLLFISHKWFSRDNVDDEKNSLFKYIINFCDNIETISRLIQDNVSTSEEISIRRSLDLSDFWVWIDFSSLPQKPRSHNEQTIFDQGLMTLNNIQTSSLNVLCWPKVETRQILLRGWCLVEAVIAYRSEQCVSPDNGTHDHIKLCSQRLMKLGSEARYLSELQKLGVSCTNGSDLEKLAMILFKNETEKLSGNPDDCCVML